MRSLILLTIMIGNYFSYTQPSFSILPNQPPANFYSIVTDPLNGDLYACTENKIFRSVDQGSTWVKLPNSGMNFIRTLYFNPTGQLFVGANQSNATPYYGIAKYDKINNIWIPMVGSPMNVSCILENTTGDLYVGTGITGNILPIPINTSDGIFVYNGTQWNTLNIGLPLFFTSNYYPYIKDLKALSNGDIITATYGNGILKLTPTGWIPLGTGATNQFVNCLYVSSTGLIYAGIDTGIITSNGGAWATASNGLPSAKPIRAIINDESGKIYASLGFYKYQKGSIKGEIFYSTNNGVLWQNGGDGLNSTAVVGLAVSGTNVFAIACGVWKATSTNNWTKSSSGMVTANNTSQIQRNIGGDLFVICRNNNISTPGCAGVFRSTDEGVSWTSINNGIVCQKSTVLFVDSYGWLWLGAQQFTGASANPAYGNPELYYSTDNGDTWIRELTIVTPNDSYLHIAENKLGVLFVTNSFGLYLSNISSSSNHGAFQNDLIPPSTPNGAKAYGLAINSQDDVFFGTETEGLFRSTSGGNAGTFTSITNNAMQGPEGNVNVFIDGNDNVFSTGTHGQVNGMQVAKKQFCSLNPNNGTNMFSFVNLPDYSGFNNMIFDHMGNVYANMNSGTTNTIQGLYVSSPPWSTTSTFTRLVTINNLSYYFSSFMFDECGYLFGTNPFGAGMYKSNAILNSPIASTLVSPLNDAVLNTTSPIFIWSHVCVPDSFKLQVSTDSLFLNMVLNKNNIIDTSYQIDGGKLVGSNLFYWRVAGINFKGQGKWSDVYSFTTDDTLCCPNGNTSIKSNVSGTSYEWQINIGGGFLPVVDNANFSGSNLSVLNIYNAPTSWYGYQFLCKTNGIAGNIFTLKFVSTWEGNFNTDYVNNLNWNCSTTPDYNTDVFINHGNVDLNYNTSCRTMILSHDAIFNVLGSYIFNINK